jgi:hypothetical protein
LEEVGQALNSVATRSSLAQFLNDTKNAEELNGLVEDIRDALMSYQVSTPKPLALIASNDTPDFITARYL